MISPTALSIFDVLCTNATATIDMLAEETTYSKSHIQQTVDVLTDNELLDSVYATEETVTFAVHPVCETYRLLQSATGHVGWNELLTPETIRICWYLNTPQEFAVVADRLDISQSELESELEDMLHCCLLIRDTENGTTTHQLAENVREPLHAFLTAAVAHFHRQHARMVAPTATIEWCDPQRALIKPHNTTDTDALDQHDDWQLTGLAKYADYDLQFFLANEPLFWYGPTELTPAEIACHTLLLGQGTRRASYTMLLIDSEDINKTDVYDEADWYALKSAFRDIYTFLNAGMTRNTQIVLPSKSEYNSLKQQYDVE